MSKIAFIFPGQGAQKPGMGKDFYEKSETARKIYHQADRLLQLDVKGLCFEENEQLNITEYTQAALLATSLALAAVIKEKGLKPEVTAGLSLGEYCAVVTAGGMCIEDAITTVRKRGILMQNAVPKGVGAMSAVLGLSGEEIEKTIEGLQDVGIANYNCPGQIVITGLTAAVEKAGKLLKDAGAKRIIPLNVSGPFHSPLLTEAGNELYKVLDPLSLGELNIPYVTNVTGAYVKDTAQIKNLLSRQVAAPVRWQQCMEAMIEDQVDTFIEIGPGKTLTGFLKKINRDIKGYSIETWADMEKVIEEIM